MYSIRFPDIFSGAKTYLLKDHDATKSNLFLILKTVTRNQLFGDPYYGTDLLSTIYQQNDVILWDIIADQIYTAIREYIPQLAIQKEDIKVYGEGTEVFASISAINRIDNTLDLYNIKLTDLSKEG